METLHSTELPISPLLPIASLEALVRNHLKSQANWIGFDALMGLALYAPGLGYYSGPAKKFGAQGDFVTAPELTPLFGACLAQQIAAWMDAGHISQVLEFGAGTGQLAAQILNELERLGQSIDRYFILELSANLRETQRATLEALAPHSLAKVEWLHSLPQNLRAVVVANEVLDAMPVKLFYWDGRQLFERGVMHDPCTQKLTWSDQQASPKFTDEVLRAIASAGFSDLNELPAPYLSELQQQGQAWISTLGECLEHGAVLTLDYGFPAREYFHLQRNRGTLACHYQHQVSFDPLIRLGEQDLTAHVDFTNLDRCAQAAGLHHTGFCSQARFLLNCGLLDRLAQQPMDQTIAYASQAQAVGKLLSEAEMGELFKAIAWVKSDQPKAQEKLLEASFAFDTGARAL